MKTLIILFALISSFSFSQECSYEVNEKDDMTGVFKKKTKLERLIFQGNSAAGIQFVKIDTSYFISLECGTSGVIDKNCDLILKFENDSTLKLKPLSIYSSTYKVDHSVIEPSYELSKNQLQIISKNKIKKARVYTTKGYIEGDIKEKHMLSVQQSANCIIN